MAIKSFILQDRKILLHRTVETVKETGKGIDGFINGPTNKDQWLIYSPTSLFSHWWPHLTQAFLWSSFSLSVYYNRLEVSWHVINFHFYLITMYLRHTSMGWRERTRFSVNFPSRLGSSYCLHYNNSLFFFTHW